MPSFLCRLTKGILADSGEIGKFITPPFKSGQLAVTQTIAPLATHYFRTEITALQSFFQVGLSLGFSRVMWHGNGPTDSGEACWPCPHALRSRCKVRNIVSHTFSLVLGAFPHSNSAINVFMLGHLSVHANFHFWKDGLTASSVELCAGMTSRPTQRPCL